MSRCFLHPQPNRIRSCTLFIDQHERIAALVAVWNISLSEQWDSRIIMNCMKIHAHIHIYIFEHLHQSYMLKYLYCVMQLILCRYV